ncbi:MAG: PQQ-dependent sugar dehydrogenase [Actinomycetota bacterium]|nr:PQQ-dependent sugar dehydrogenase [Actinomycetota bacterium]
MAGPAHIRGARVICLLALLAVLAGCTGAGADPDPTWVPVPSLSPLPFPTPNTGGSSSPAPDPNQPVPPTPRSSGPTVDPNVVATKLAAPLGIAVLPDRTALVGERISGRIIQVQPVPGKPVKLVRTVPGLDPSGGGGLLDLALSATYTEDGLILALITTATDVRLVHFTLTGPITPVLTGIPRGRSDNVGRLLVLDSGVILVGTGDAARPSLALDPASLAGKVLRVDDVGQPAAGNPKSTSRVFTSGHRTVNGLCTDPDGRVFEAEAGGADELNILTPGAAYGWPSGGQTGQRLPAEIGGVSGCAVSAGSMFITGLGGKDLFRTTLDRNGHAGEFIRVFNRKYGRLATVITAPDGTLWLTTSNRDGSGRPVAADERVLHIQPPRGGGGTSPV